MKKNIFVVLVILSFSIFVTPQAFAARGDSVTSVGLSLPMAWQFDDGLFVSGLGAGINQIVLPDKDSLMGVDYGATLSVPLNLYEQYAFPLNLQLMFGILVVPFNLEKWFLGLGAAFGISMSYALPKNADFLQSEFSLDFGVGGEIRGGFMVTKKFAIAFGCTVLYDFYKLDLQARQYIPEHRLAVLPSIGVGIRR